MSLEEIVLPITEPETEWVRGRALRKLSPTRDHGRVQLVFAAALDAWARGRGEVATEWRFRLAVAGDVRRPLVPDIAFVAVERLRGSSREKLQAPEFAPTVAVEVLSPGDDPLDVASKVDVYLGAGSALVVLVDPIARTMSLCDRERTRALAEGSTFRHNALPGFNLSLTELFATALDRRP